MQIFSPCEHFDDITKCLDGKRLNKQKIEIYQILDTLRKGPLICCVCKESTNYQGLNDCACPTNDGPHNPIKTPWYNHPATQMARGHELFFIAYAYQIIDECLRRKFKDTMFNKFWELSHNFKLTTAAKPWYWGNEQFHLSHKSNLVRKFPEHYKKFWPDVPDNLPYWWPTKQP